MTSNLRPDYGIETLGKAEPCLTEAIANPATSPTMDSTPLDADGQMSTDNDAIIEDPEEYIARTKSLDDFYEELIISRAPPEVRDENKPRASASPDEIAAYRGRVFNHKKTRHRFVFQVWPRDPKGDCIRPGEGKPGKMTPNNQQIWGATLLDFYTVNRLPSAPSYVTYSSGSRLARWMKEHGETEAQDMIERQEDEPDPQLILPTDIGRLITDNEFLLPNKSWEKVDPKGKAKGKKCWELPEVWPPPSPFHPSAYPRPWPTEPYSNDFLIRIPTLQHYIRQSLLPRKLVVHDPWGLLRADTISGPQLREQQQQSWREQKDIRYHYKLQNSATNTKRRERDDEEAKADEEKRRKVRETFLADPHTRNALPKGFLIHRGELKPGPCVPPIFIVLPFLPDRDQPDEAHLYIAPAGKIGEGHHSFVYRAELELPRNQLIKEHVCKKCVLEDMHDIIREQDGDHNERRDPKWDKNAGTYVLKTFRQPMVVTTMMNNDTGKEEEYILKEGKVTKELKYEGPFRVIESRVQYPDLSKRPYCKHLQEQLIHPLTSKVEVAAKLSKYGDAHLAREAENYQAFPRHFFEHWSGYNIISPLHDPVPVGPVVPQFYGYYVVDNGEGKSVGTQEDQSTMEVDQKSQEEDSADDTRSMGSNQTWPDESTAEDQKKQEGSYSGYLSPILLLEKCGNPIDPAELSIDDKCESASLVYRFHEEGWIHGSIARRNIVRQAGPLSAWPLERMVNVTERGGYGTDWSFRLIDFGRSRKLKDEELQLGRLPNELQLGRLPNDMYDEDSVITNWIQGWGDEIH